MRNDVTLIAAGQEHSLAATADGAVWAWGDDSRGQLGVGEAGGRAHRSLPVRVPLPAEVARAGVRALCAGGQHSALLAADGALYAWGGARMAH